ncbi:hypothetical protein GMMP1_200010 [Candidatus Magnetomoraceae bacterium gMMP-1]
MFDNSTTIINHFSDQDLHPQAQSYIETHARRFAFLISEIKSIYKQLNKTSLVAIDIGPSFFTELYRLNFQMIRCSH